MPTSAARARTATSEMAFQAESSAEINQSQPINPKINHRTARKTADQARDVRRERAVSLVFMLHLSSVPCGFRLRASAPSLPSPHGRGRVRMGGSLGNLGHDGFCQAVGGNEL